MADTDNRMIFLEKRLTELYQLRLIDKNQLDAIMNIVFASGIAPSDSFRKETIEALLRASKVDLTEWHNAIEAVTQWLTRFNNL